jgi:hypothetical protein
MAATACGAGVELGSESGRSTKVAVNGEKALKMALSDSPPT